MKFIKFLLKTLGLIIHHLSRLVPRAANKWVFGSYFTFADNAKYLFCTIYDSHPEITAIWISHRYKDVSLLRSKGMKAFYWLSPIGIYHCFTAKVYVSTVSVSDINAYTSGGAFFVNLWHGVGVKRVRWLAPELFMGKYNLASPERMHTSLKFRIEVFPYLFRKPDLYLVPSRFQAERFFAPMFELPLSKCLLANYPRNEILLWKEEAILEFVRRYEPENTMTMISRLKSYKRVYIYMPTWRNDQSDFVGAAGINWQELNSVLEKNDALFILKLHPHTHLDLLFIGQFGNIMNFPPGCDVYTILPFTDCLITDYSSIYADYSLMNKEIILFVFDYLNYVKGSYELEEYNKYYPGTRAYSFEDLLHLIKHNIDCHVSKQEHAFIMKTFWDAAFDEVDVVSEIKKRIELS